MHEENIGKDLTLLMISGIRESRLLGRMEWEATSIIIAALQKKNEDIFITLSRLAEPSEHPHGEVEERASHFGRKAFSSR
ncbi:hypothetical protein J2129_001220 [Methanofollis sp. W23]|uniref:hypothetical protein n=1 Tax=Methanofollis sp. W23 TaxID=2817849 RepID=UPI001AE8EFC8|nr:hypothetical protein [Methanofollis sp. W23]MBP2145766.1 hypothetical protein [Methanofollis sp. W23]